MTERPPNRAPATTATRENAPDEEDAYFGPGDAEHASAVPGAPPPGNVLPDTPTTERPPTHPAARDVRALPLNRHQSAIRLRRLRGTALPSRLDFAPGTEQNPAAGRRRSSSEPQRPANVSPARTAWSALPSVTEAPPSHQGHGNGPMPAPAQAPGLAAIPRGAPAQKHHRHFPWAGRRRLTVQGQPLSEDQAARDCYDSRIVDFLDVVDPEVAALSSITNIQNSLFVPSLGKWVNRRPTYDLSQLPRIPGAFPPSKEDVAAAEAEGEEPPAGTRSPSLSSVLSEPQYAILPDDASLAGWPPEDIRLLNDHIRHMLHSRRSKIKQRFKAFGKYASRPLGFLVTLYATLITLFGLAWVLFLIGWIYVGDQQLYIINVIDYVLVALFAIVGDGLAPFRAIDTYHMIFVARYHRKTWKLRERLLLPDLRDHNDLPTGSVHSIPEDDVEAQSRSKDDEFFPVLSEKEQARLVHHQAKLAKSHTFYKPHETETHHAFPLRLLITVVVLLDLHSCLQIALGACTWGIPYQVRSSALTTTLLCCSITTNIVAGIVISIGDRRTRKRDVLERLATQNKTKEVMEKMRKKKEKEEQKDESKRESEDGGGKTGRSSLAATLSIPARLGKSRMSGEKESAGKGAEVPPTSDDGNEKDELEDARFRVPGALPSSDSGT